MWQIYNSSEKLGFLGSLVNAQWTESWESHCTIKEFGMTSDLRLLTRTDRVGWDMHNVCFITHMYPQKYSSKRVGIKSDYVRQMRKYCCGNVNANCEHTLSKYSLDVSRSLRILTMLKCPIIDIINDQPFIPV